MNLATIIVALILFIICVLVVRSMIKNRKYGSCSCGNDCSCCASQCSSSNRER